MSPLNAMHNGFYRGYTHIASKAIVSKLRNTKRNMQRFRRNNRDAKDAQARHLNQPDLYLLTVDEARDPICKSRRSGTKLRSDGSSKTATSFQMPDIRTSEKTNHKVNEKKTGKRKASTSSHRRSSEIGNTKNTLKLRVTAD